MLLFAGYCKISIAGKQVLMRVFCFVSWRYRLTRGRSEDLLVFPHIGKGDIEAHICSCILVRCIAFLWNRGVEASAFDA